MKIAFEHCYSWSILNFLMHKFLELAYEHYESVILCKLGFAVDILCL